MNDETGEMKASGDEVVVKQEEIQEKAESFFSEGADEVRIRRLPLDDFEESTQVKEQTSEDT